MAKFLLIDGDGTEFVVAAANLGRGGTTVGAVHAWSADQPLTPASAESLGRALRERLAEWKFAGPLVVVVGRDRLVLKEIRHPAVPAHEEPAIVRFQAMKELTDAGDDVVIDYQPRPADGGERKALAFALRRETLRAFQLLAQGAGLKLHAVVPRAYGLLNLARSANPPPEPGEAFAVLTLHAGGGEFVVARGDQLHFARPVAGPALASPAVLLGEVRRNLAVYSGQSAGQAVRALYVAEGPSPPGVTDHFRNTLAVPVHPLVARPPAGTTAGAAAGVLGVAPAVAAPPINFVKPREPKAAADPHRRPILFAAAAAAAVALALGILAFAQLSAKDREVARLRLELGDLTDRVAKVDPDARRWDELKKWLDTEVIWLDELYDLTARAPDVSKLRVIQLSADPLALPATADPRRKPYVGRLTVDGIANEESQTLNQFTREFVKDGTYKVETPLIKPNTLMDRRQFAQQFTAKFELEKRPPASYNRRLTAAAPERRRPGGMNFMNLFPGGQP
jgi:hypothetical protein